MRATLTNQLPEPSTAVSRARTVPCAPRTRLATHAPAMGLGLGTPASSHLWTDAIAVTAKAFGAYGAPRLSDPPT